MSLLYMRVMYGWCPTFYHFIMQIHNKSLFSHVQRAHTSQTTLFLLSHELSKPYYSLTHTHFQKYVCGAWTTYFKLMDCQLMMLAKYLTPHNHHVATIVCSERCKRGVSLIRATTIDYCGLVIMLMRCHDALQLDRDLQIY
mgnify:CR=1 FL=1